MTEDKLHEIEQLKRDELMRRAHEIVLELYKEIKQYHKLAVAMEEIVTPVKSELLTDYIDVDLVPMKLLEYGRVLLKEIDEANHPTMVLGKDGNVRELND